ncbi:GTP-binding protein EngB [Algimonas ampicilliniresistens]|uniref:Probable GTP-binding protein EngB n=1 Tax=Algimonas ampicilliniresistens TaxID=1298735 RepID=A0ABQ5V9P7_9PROT|nr:ribosome biogenesis GTP-binding protein YihA/YsxC [Algimonas ampicilliniresistens]GLQ24165.1 GTP-binding protein EngB [Algimonas ampicilliniresistens]
MDDPKTFTPIVAEYNSGQIEDGRLLFARPVTFMKSAVSLETLPPMGLTEVCFAGRSNVGKSTLINALTNQSGLARASNTPGRTQELNYFSAQDRLYLVDLPGYGYAKAPKHKIAAWNKLTRAFLRGRATLRRVFVLVDSRHGLMPVDQELMNMLDETAVTYQVVLTKADKLKKGQLARVHAETAKKLAKRPAAFPVVALTSADKGLGMPELRAEIASLALPIEAL